MIKNHLRISERFILSQNHSLLEFCFCKGCNKLILLLSPCILALLVLACATFMGSQIFRTAAFNVPCYVNFCTLISMRRNFSPRMENTSMATWQLWFSDKWNGQKNGSHSFFFTFERARFSFLVERVENLHNL